METGCRMTTTDDSGRNVASAPYPLTAGVTLSATGAMAGQEVWTRDQVAYVVALAFWSGSGVSARHDALELAEFAWSASIGTEWVSPAERIRRRIAAMGQRHELVLMRWRQWPALEPGQRTGLMERDARGRPVKPRVVPVGEPCDPDVVWPEVAVPGGSAPC